MNRVVITGIGLVTPIAIGRTESWEGLLAGKSGAGPITLFDASAFRVRFAAEVKNWDGSRYVEKKKLKEMDRFTEFACGAARMAIGVTSPIPVMTTRFMLMGPRPPVLAVESHDEAGSFP
ncbi:MAG TPA: beta-ketoacyl synthase N-terminal-like domain-containing protein, partial [Labilithrix sp.]|nr:beta-ketoacyl synthase N-terminal-like domain-containing protein [Labilithrix sp.]